MCVFFIDKKTNQRAFDSRSTLVCLSMANRKEMKAVCISHGWAVQCEHRFDLSGMLSNRLANRFPLGFKSSSLSTGTRSQGHETGRAAAGRLLFARTLLVARLIDYPMGNLRFVTSRAHAE